MKSMVIFFALIAVSQGTFLKFLWTSPTEENNNEKEEDSSTTEQSNEETFSFHPIPLPVSNSYVVKPPHTVYEDDDTNPNIIPPPNFYQVPPHIVNNFIPPKDSINIVQNLQHENYPVLVKNPAILPQQFYASNILLPNVQWAFSPNFIPVGSIPNEDTHLSVDQTELSKDNHIPIQDGDNEYEKYPVFVNRPAIPENQFYGGNNIVLPNVQQWPYPLRFIPASSISNEESHLTADQTDIPANYQPIPEENLNQYENYPPFVKKPTTPEHYFDRGNNIILPNAQQFSYPPNFVPVSSNTNEEASLTSDEAHLSEDFSVPPEHYFDRGNNIILPNAQQFSYPPNFVPVSSNTNEEASLTSYEAHLPEDFSVPIEHNPNQYENYQLLVNKPAIPDNQFYEGGNNVILDNAQQWPYPPNFAPSSSTENEESHLGAEQLLSQDISISSEHNPNQYENNQFYEANISPNEQQWPFQSNIVSTSGSSYKETHLTSDQTHIPADETNLSVNENESSQELLIESSHESSSNDELSKEDAVINFNNIGDENNNNEYYHSYTLDDGTTVVEEGNLVEKDGSVVLVKHGEYQRQESDGKISSVKWIADESGFRITE